MEGGDGWTLVTRQKVKTKVDGKAKLEDVAKLLKKQGFKSSELTWVREDVQTRIPYGSLLVAAHLAIGKGRLRECAKKAENQDAKAVLRSVNFHITLEVGDDHYETTNPRWRGGGQGQADYGWEPVDLSHIAKATQAVQKGCAIIQALRS